MNAEQFYKEIYSTLENYCNARKIPKYLNIFWSQPASINIAKQLLNNISPDDLKADLLTKLYKNYEKLLKLNSKEHLVCRLAMLMAAELDIPSDQVSKYHSIRCNFIENHPKISCITSIPSFFKKPSNSDDSSIHSVLIETQVDPIHQAYNSYMDKRLEKINIKQNSFVDVLIYFN